MKVPSGKNDMEYLRQSSLNLLFLKIILFSVFLTPSFDFSSSAPSIRVDDLLALAWFFFYFFHFFRKFGQKRARLYLILAIGCVLPISIMNGILGGYHASFGDFNQYIRLIKYASIYVLASSVFRDVGEKGCREILEYILFLGLLVFILALFQYFDFFGLNKYYLNYVAPVHYHTLVGGYSNPRPVGMTGNPNKLGFLFALVFFVSIYFALGEKRRLIRWCVYFMSMLLVFGVILSLSRGAMAALIAGITVFVGISFGGMNLRQRLIVFAFIFLFLMVGAYVLSLESFYDAFMWRFALGFDLEDEGSMGARLYNWTENINIIRSHPIIGVGPLSRQVFSFSADNEWILLWRAYGVIGVAIFISLMMVGIFDAKKGAVLRGFNFAIVISTFTYMIPAAAFSSLELFSLILILLAFVDSAGFYPATKIPPIRSTKPAPQILS